MVHCWCDLLGDAARWPVSVARPCVCWALSGVAVCARHQTRNLPIPTRSSCPYRKLVKQRRAPANLSLSLSLNCPSFCFHCHVGSLYRDPDRFIMHLDIVYKYLSMYIATRMKGILCLHLDYALSPCPHACIVCV